MAALLLVGCGLEPTPRPAVFDCTTIDRAAERFPDACGEPAGDAGPMPEAAPDAGSTP